MLAVLLSPDPGAPPIAAMARNALTHNVAESILQSIDEYWREREEPEQVAKETVELRKLLHHKRKHAVPEDLWLESAAPGGEQQHVSAVVSETYVLQQLRKVIEKREEWLRQEKLPMDCQMRTGEDMERDLFCKYCKAEFHAQPHQKEQQSRDARTSAKQVHQGKHSRWGREMQIRLGSKVLWELVNFVGKSDVELLRQAAEKADVGASLPDESDVGASQLDAPDRVNALKKRLWLRRATSVVQIVVQGEGLKRTPTLPVGS